MMFDILRYIPPRIVQFYSTSIDLNDVLAMCGEMICEKPESAPSIVRKFDKLDFLTG